MTQFSLALLGSLDARAGNMPITAFRTDKTRALLAYLALESGQPHSRRVLAGLLWPNMREQRSLDNVRVTLHRLRQTLDNAHPRLSADLFSVTRQTIQLNPGPIQLDVAEFDALLTATATHPHHALHTCEACLAQLQDAAALYRGELLAGLSVADAPAFEEWLALRRELLNHKALVILQHLGDAYEQRGEWAKAHEFAARQLQLDPYREAAHRQLMRILAQRGLTNQALAQYTALRRLLYDEMGVEPDPATDALYAAISNGTQPPPPGQLNVTPSTLLATTLPDTPLPTPAPLSTTYPNQDSPRLQNDWEQMPNSAAFYGRNYELRRLIHWLTEESTPLVLLLGMGGVGKSTLAAHAAQTVASRFDRVIWRSLLNAPPLEALLLELLQTLVAADYTKLPPTIDEQMTLLLIRLRQQRVLLILDNVESILDPIAAGHFRASYAPYEQLLQRIVTTQHQSTILLTSREQPNDLAQREADSPHVRSLYLQGLDEAAGRDLLAARGLQGDTHEQASLVARYSGNPLALKLVADTVDELFGGDINSFLAEETWVFDDVRTMLDQQLQRLSDLERELLYWLAIERRPVSAPLLRQNLVIAPLGARVLEALRGLQKRTLVEPHAHGLMLQNVITEYLTDRLIERACAEIIDEAPLPQDSVLHHFALLKADADDDIRNSQARLILAPLAAQLQAKLGRTELVAKIRGLIAACQARAPRQPTYVAGNLLNLLLHQELPVTGYDFSQLSIWHADLRGANLTAVNFTAADLTHSVFTEAFGRIFALALTPAGNDLAAGDTQGRVQLWSFPSGQNTAILVGHTNSVMALAFHPDGSHLVSGSLDRTIRIWRWQSGELAQVLTGHTSAVFSVAISPDGQWLASGSQDNSVRIWDFTTGTLLADLRVHTNVVTCVAFDAAGKRLASGSEDHTIILWDLLSLHENPNANKTPSPLTHLPHTKLQGHTHEIHCLAFSPRDKLLATGSADTTIHLWNLTDNTIVATLRGHTHWVRALAFQPDGARLYSAGGDRTVRVWDMDAYRILRVMHRHEHTVRALAIHPNGALLASGGLDDTIRLWDLQRQHDHHAIRTIRGYVTTIRTLNFSHDGQQLAAGDGKGWVRLWTVGEAGSDPSASAAELAAIPISQPVTLPGRGQQVNCVTFSTDDRWLAAADDDYHVRIWDRATRQRHLIISEHRTAAHVVRFAPPANVNVNINGNVNVNANVMATAGYDGAIYLWDITTPSHPKLRHMLVGHTLEVNDLGFIANGEFLLSCAADHTVRLWRVATGACEQVVETTLGRCLSLAIDDTRGTVAVAGARGKVWTMRLLEGNLTFWQTIAAHVTPVYQTIFSPDGQRLVTVSEGGTARLWDVASGNNILSLYGHTQPIRAAAFHPHGTLLATGSDDETVRLWDVAGAQPTGALLRVLTIPGPYTDMNISGAVGITPAQRRALIALGAIDRG